MYKEKAKELFDQMYAVTDPLHKYPMCFDTAKACTIIQIKNIIKALVKLDEDNFECFGVVNNELVEDHLLYWEEILKAAEEL